MATIYHESDIYESGGGGSSQITVVPPISGDGSSENPLTVDESEILKSKLEFTMDLGSVVNAGYDTGAGALFLRGCLFELIMNQSIIKGSTDLFFAVSQLGSGNECYFAIYELDLMSGQMAWIANTENIMEELDSNTGTVGLHRTKFEYVKNDEYNLRSDKLYYFIQIGDLNGVQFVGNEIFKNLNTFPYPCFKMDNLESSYTGITPATLGTSTLANISAADIRRHGGESLIRIFAAFGNLSG